MSGADEEVEKSISMELYRRRNGKKDKDHNMTLAPPFKFTDAVLYLSQEPKFSDRYSDEKAKVPGRDINGATKIQEAGFVGRTGK